mgnify:CR=1 FL=1
MSERTHLVAITVNGEPRTVAVGPDTTLKQVLREDLRLTGTKSGCDAGDCGACSVMLDGQLVCSCLVLGAEVEAVHSGSRTLKDAVNEAMRDWVTNVDNTFYIIGTVAGPHPYPAMVRDFQSVIGNEVREQIMQKEGRLPDSLVACIGGGSNAMGMFYPFIGDDSVRLVGVEAAGLGVGSGKHAASISAGGVGVLHGNKTYLLQDDDGQIQHAHSISAGLDYPGVGPEHAFLNELGRAEYVAVTDQEALDAFQLLTELEGIIPALESSHAIAQVVKLAPELPPDAVILVCLSGRGDKDIHTVAEAMGVEL